MSTNQIAAGDAIGQLTLVDRVEERGVRRHFYRSLPVIGGVVAETMLSNRLLSESFGSISCKKSANSLRSAGEFWITQSVSFTPCCVLLKQTRVSVNSLNKSLRSRAASTSRSQSPPRFPTKYGLP